MGLCWCPSTCRTALPRDIEQLRCAEAPAARRLRHRELTAAPTPADGRLSRAHTKDRKLDLKAEPHHPRLSKPQRSSGLPSPTRHGAQTGGTRRRDMSSRAEGKLRSVLRGLSATLERDEKDKVGTQVPGERSAPACRTKTPPASPAPAGRARAGTGQHRRHLRGWGRLCRRGTPGRAACSG